MSEDKDAYIQHITEKHSRFQVSEEVLREVVESAVGEKIADKERIIIGEANEIYFVETRSDNLVVRIARGEPEKFYREKWAIERSGEAGVPVPEIVAVQEVSDDGENLVFMIQKRILGIPFNDLIRQGKLNITDIERITTEMGRMLARIHSVKTQDFGTIDRNGLGEYSSWEEYMIEPQQPGNLRAILKAARTAGISSTDIDKAIQILVDSQSLYINTAPHLLHGDFGPKHTLLENGRITGIIDFEIARSGDPIADFSWWSYFGNSRPDIGLLKKGYEQAESLGKNYESRLHLGRLRLNMDLIYYFSKEKHHPGLKTAKVKLQEDLDYFK